MIKTEQYRKKGINEKEGVMTQEDEFLTIVQVAEYLNLKVSRIRYAIQKKQIPYIKINRLIRFERVALKSWLHKLSHYPSETPTQFVRELRNQLKLTKKLVRPIF